MKMTTLRNSVAAALCAMAFIPAQAANLVQNGSFEIGYPGDNICGAWWYSVGYGCNPNTLSIPGWTVSGFGVDWHNIGPVPEPRAADGVHAIDLVGGGPGVISQDIPTVAGGSYTLTFSYARHSVCSPFPGGAVGEATVGNIAGLLLVPFAGAVTSSDWETGTIDFTATGPSTTISFRSLFGGFCGGVVIDNVVVESLLPDTVDECKKGGWRAYGVFRNQGDCVSFVVTNGRNPPAN